jgi:hypothetical protein
MIVPPPPGSPVDGSAMDVMEPQAATATDIPMYKTTVHLPLMAIQKCKDGDGAPREQG